MDDLDAIMAQMRMEMGGAAPVRLLFFFFFFKLWSVSVGGAKPSW